MRVLLVEDDEPIAESLTRGLSRYGFEVQWVRTGTEALAADDFVLALVDLGLPDMDGLDVCRELRARGDVPIIVISARSDEVDRVVGLEIGADDYVTKPFSFEILQSRIRNLLQRRQAMRQSLGSRIEVKASEIQISSLDEKLIEKAVKFVEEHISDPDFTVETLSHELGMSRVHLYKKLVALTGKSPLEFIRTLRLQRAAQLLEKSQLTVAEVAYKVGFNNPKYFARYFKEQFNVLPSLYAGRK